MITLPGATQQITVLNATQGPANAHGQKRVTFTEGETVTGHLFQQAGRELVDGQWVVVQRWKALLPPHTQVGHKDLLRDEAGNRFRVEQVSPRRGPGGLTHLSLELWRVSDVEVN